MNATKEKKTIFYMVDPRPVEERLRKLFECGDYNRDTKSAKPGRRRNMDADPLRKPAM